MGEIDMKIDITTEFEKALNIVLDGALDAASYHYNEHRDQESEEIKQAVETVKMYLAAKKTSKQSFYNQCIGRALRKTPGSN